MGPHLHRYPGATGRAADRVAIASSRLALPCPAVLPAVALWAEFRRDRRPRSAAADGERVRFRICVPAAYDRLARPVEIRCPATLGHGRPAGPPTAFPRFAGIRSCRHLRRWPRPSRAPGSHSQEYCRHRRPTARKRRGSRPRRCPHANPLLHHPSHASPLRICRQAIVAQVRWPFCPRPNRHRVGPGPRATRTGR